MSGPSRRAPPAPLSSDVDPPSARSQRDTLVDRLVALGTIRDPRVIAAMRYVPRHVFLPEPVRDQAYGDHPVPIAREQTISQPTIVGIMTEALELGGDERVLEIGTGSGYQAAILAMLAREVLTVERIAELGQHARAELDRLGLTNLRYRIGDGYRGWPEEAPFDRVILTAAPPALPEALVAQLGEGGIVVAPVGASSEQQRLVRGTKRGDKVRWEDLGGVSFLPLVPDPKRGTVWN